MGQLSDYLISVYAPTIDEAWRDKEVPLRKVVPASIVFEIADKEEEIVQPTGKGVSVIRRGTGEVEVIDLEAFTATVHGTDHTPRCCDFVLSPVVGDSFLVLNELTRTKSEYILPFVQPQDRVPQPGKLEYAKLQLAETIDRLYRVSDFCDQYESRIALFSCRLSDKSGSGIMARSAKAFSKTIYTLQRMKLHETLPHGFVLEMRVYEAEYKLPT